MQNVSYFEHDLSNMHYSIFVLQPAAQRLAVRGLCLYFGGVSVQGMRLEVNCICWWALEVMCWIFRSCYKSHSL